MRVKHVERRIDQQTKLRNFIRSFIRNLTSIGLENVTRHRAEARRALLEEKWLKFLANHDALTVAITKVSSEEKERILQRPYYRRQYYDSTQECYREVLEKANTIIDKDKTTERKSSTTLSISSRSGSQATVHQGPGLQPLDLPKFDGNVANSATQCSPKTTS